MVDEFRKRLIKLDITAESIVGTTSLFFQHVANGQPKSSKLIDAWFEMLKHAASQQHLAYLYLSNDIIQHSHKHDGNQSLREFGEVIEPALYYIYAVNPDLRVRGEVIRIIDIWLDRQIYEKVFLTNVKKKLKLFSAKSFNRTTQIKANHDPKDTDAIAQSLKENAQMEEELEKEIFDKYLMLNYNKIEKHLETLSDTYDLMKKWNVKCEFLSDTLSKIVSNRMSYSDVDIECKLAEFKRAVQTEADSRRQLVKGGSEALQKQENLLHQEYFMMKGMGEKIEELKRRMSLMKTQDPANDAEMKEA